MTGLNYQNDLVGYYLLPNSPVYMGFVDNAGIFATLDGPPDNNPSKLGGGGFQPHDIDDAGVIVGTYMFNGSIPAEEGVIATPMASATVPEPASVALLATTALSALCLRRQRG